MPTDPDKTTRLHGLKVREVSLVDHPANEEVFLLIKRIEQGAPMLLTDTPLIKAAKAASDKNEEEKAEQEEAQKAEPEMGKIAAMAMDYAKALLSIDHSKMAESNEYKSLMAALEQLAASASESMKGMHDKEEKEEEEKGEAANKMDHGDKEEKEDEEKAQKMDHDKEEKEDEEKAQKSDQSAAASDAGAGAGTGDQNLSDIRDLLAQLHSKLGPAADAEKAANEAALAKALTGLTERIDRLGDRLSTVEKARGVSRGEGDNKSTNVEKSQSIFAGLI